MTTRAFKPITGVPASDEEISAFAARKGIPTLSEVPAPVAPPAIIPTPAATPTVRVSLELPVAIADELHTRAFQQRCSKRHVIMLALKQAGFSINDDDLIPDGRRVR